MSRFANLKLTTKFNIIIALLLLALFVSAAVYSYYRQQSLIIKGAVDNARIISQQIIQSRDYMSSVIKNEPAQNYALVPQVVATQIARRITKTSPFYVRQVSLRYRNPRNSPDPYEAQQLRRYAQKNFGEAWNIVQIDHGQELRYMLPMVAEKSCLQCHSSYETAPRFVQARFPKGHFSYNYKLGEIIGAVSVGIPMDKLYREIGYNLKVDLLYRGAMFAIVLLMLSVLIHRTILDPIKKLADLFTEVTRTGSFSSRIKRRTNDEIGQLISAFNEMMEELENRTLQRAESDERYRSFIEIAQSPVVTFLEDGKIIISNQRAEELFGLSRTDLLGINLFGFFEDGKSLQQGITAYVKEEGGGGVGETTRHRVRDARGNMVEVDLALSASRADGSVIFTGILRKAPIVKK